MCLKTRRGCFVISRKKKHIKEPCLVRLNVKAKHQAFCFQFAGKWSSNNAKVLECLVIVSATVRTAQKRLCHDNTLLFPVSEVKKIPRKMLCEEMFLGAENKTRDLLLKLKPK